MAIQPQLGFDQDFDTSRPANYLYCHQDFLEKLASYDRDSIGRRTSFVMQRLSVDSRRIHYKPTYGVNRGWRRSRLGGNRGSHFYLWWAPKNALPLRESAEFSNVPDGTVFLRDIRHHDDHSLLNPQSFSTNYMPVTVRELRSEEYGPAPWTPPQLKFASARQPVRLLKGHPGSGKTTALWHAADMAGVERVLYVTYSLDLAALAKEYFDRFCSSRKQFHVITFPNLVRQVLGMDLPIRPDKEHRHRFLTDLLPFNRSLGPWSNNQVALYDEFYAHMIGDALPVSVGRFAGSKTPRVSDKAFRERRTRYLGQGAASAVVEAATRLERLDALPLADRYFPELALAWRAVERLRGTAPVPDLAKVDCIAVDECQDLTPIEAQLIIELALRAGGGRRMAGPVLLAGDEAQTVRPTDFEWGWLSDLIHAQLGSPSEYRLTSNLRTPHRIAELVNRVWDLYSFLQKQERPSGTGYAIIEDDAADQILYCTATPGPELDQLLIALANREGLALITLDETPPSYVPEAARPAVLTVSEAKGLDFHSVCVLDAGRHVERIVRDDQHLRSDTDVESLRKRLAIDQLRVALSRPTERLFWLDFNPKSHTVRQSISFLNGGEGRSGVSSCVPAAVLKMLEEDELDAEERIQRCQVDARQFLSVKPEIAWSRAQQAVTLLGRPGTLAAISDQAACESAHLTLAEVCFTLGLRNTSLPPELGAPDLFEEATRAARSAKRFGLATVIDLVGRAHRESYELRINHLVELARLLPGYKQELEPWMLLELGTRSKAWIEQLEAAFFSGSNAAILLPIMPAFYETLDVPDRVQRIQRLRQKSIQLLMKEKLYSQALEVLQALPERSHKLEAQCHEGLKDFRQAAKCYLDAGDPKEALNAYRAIPDLQEALKLVDQIENHPAADSLRWIVKLQALVTERPEKFTKVVTPAEKKMLEETLERALGVTRKKPAATKKAPAKKKAPAAPKKRTSRKPWDDIPF